MSNSGFGDGYPKILEPVHPNQSMWMNRLIKTSCNPSLHVQNQFPCHEESRGEYLEMEQGARFVKTSEPSSHTRLDINAAPSSISEYRSSWRCQPEGIIVGSAVPHSVKAVEMVTEAQRVEITYETLTTNSRNLRIPRSELQPSLFKFTQNMGNILGQKRLAVSIEHKSITQTDGISTRGNTMETSNFHFLSKARGSAPAETFLRLKEHPSQPESRLQCQKQLAKPFLSFDRNILPVPRDNLAGSYSSFVPNSQGASIEHINNANITRMGHDKHKYHNYSSVFVCDKEIDNYHSRNCENPYTWKKNDAVQPNDPSTSNFCFPTADGEPRNKTHEFITSGHPPSHSRPSQQNKIEELNNGCHSLSVAHQPVRQVGERRLLSSSNSIEGPPRGPRFSQTNNHASIQDVSKEDQVLRASTIFHKLKASSSHGRFTLLPGFDCQDKCREKLTPLGSPRNSEGEEDERTASLASKNESSAETDIMDINVCPTWNSLPSITSSPSYKEMMSGKRPAMSHSPMSRANHLPNINQEPPAPLAAEQDPANMDVSTSRTESLDADHLHFDSSSSAQQQRLIQKSDPSSRWVKRLKLSSPSYYYAHGTKLDNQTDPMDLDKQTDSMGSNKGISLVHPWIQRWCHNQAAHPEMTMESSERVSSKMELSDYQTKQCPSIAAMALMGKTMTGLQSCKFQNKGSFVVWGKGGFSE